MNILQSYSSATMLLNHLRSIADESSEVIVPIGTVYAAGKVSEVMESVSHGQIKMLNPKKPSNLKTDTAFVYKIGNRWLNDFKSGRIQTAHSIAGAMIFGEWEESKMAKLESGLAEKRVEFVKLRIGIID